MEEILASIRRIIAEDERPAESAPAAAAESPDKSDVLELTDALNEDGSVRHLDPAVPAGPVEPAVAEAAPIAPPALPGGRIEPEPPRHGLFGGDAMRLDDSPGTRMAEGRMAGGRIVSNATSGAAAASFARLAAMPRERRAGDMLIGAGDRTLEDIVRDELRPLLQSWLDEHLPGLVERLVREEITRVVGESGLR
jgi:cell pole-organizing protein PopZ